MKRLFVHKFFTLKEFHKFGNECKPEEIVTDKNWSTFLSQQRDSDQIVYLSSDVQHVELEKDEDVERYVKIK
jgi:hypothetical protein